MTGTLDELLAGHAFLSGLPEGTVELVAACARPAAFEPGSLLLSEGGVADTLHLVVRGRVAIEVHGPGRGRLLVDTVGPGHVVGLSWLSPPFRWHFDARAVDEVATVAIDSELLRARLAEHPRVGFALLERLSSVLLGRLQATRVRLLDLYGDGTGH